MKDNVSDDLGSFLALMGVTPDEAGFFWRQLKSGKTVSATVVNATHWGIARLEPPGKLRRVEHFVSLRAVVIDDVGTKRNRPPVEPSFKIETRPGNEQWVYVIQDDDATLDEVRVLLDVLNHEGQYGDPGSYDCVHVFRLPGGRLPPGKTDPARLVPPELEGEVPAWTIAELYAEFAFERGIAERLEEKRQRRAERAAQRPGGCFPEARALIDLISPDLERNDGWMRVIMALHYESNGSDEGLRLAHEWSAPGRSYDPVELDYQWGNLDSRDPIDPARVGSIRELARQADEVAAEAIIAAHARLRHAPTDATLAAMQTAAGVVESDYPGFADLKEAVDPEVLAAAWGPPDPPAGGGVPTLDPGAIPGLVGALTRYGAARAMRQTALPSFVGALAGVSALIGDSWIGRFNDRDTIANLYAALIMPTGSGKEDAIDIARATIAGNDRVVFASGYASAQALQRALIDNRRQICITDEYGRWLASMNAKSGSPDFATFSLLMEIYNRAAGVLPAKRYANSRNSMGEVQGPLMNFVGITTEASLTEALLSPAVIRDGFLNRPIHFYEGEVPQADYFRPRPKAMPGKVAAALTRLREHRFRELLGKPKNEIEWVPQPADVTPDEAALAVMLEARSAFEEQRCSGAPTAPVWNRADQNTRKLAVVLAVGIAAMDPDADLNHVVIDAATMRLAVELVRQGTERLAAWAGEELAASPEDGVRKRLLAAVTHHADDEGWAVWQRVMQAAKNGRDAPHRMVKSELEGLIEDGQLVKETRDIPGTRGPKPTFLRIARHRNYGESPGTKSANGPAVVPAFSSQIKH